MRIACNLNSISKASSVEMQDDETFSHCRELEVKALADVAQALEQGNSRRTVAAHNLNEFSSRSHAVLQVGSMLPPEGILRWIQQSP